MTACAVVVFLIRSVGLMHGKGSKKKYPLIKPSYEAKATRGLFVLGTASHSVDFRKSAGGFIHGFRYTGERKDISWQCGKQKMLSLLAKTSLLLKRPGLFSTFTVCLGKLNEL